MRDRKQFALYHFPSKESPVAVHQKMPTTGRGPRLLAAATSGDEQFDALMSELIAFFAADPDRARLVVREVLDRPDEVGSLIKLRVRPWVDKICDYIRKGQVRGAIFPDVDPEAYVVQVINLVIAGVGPTPVSRIYPFPAPAGSRNHPRRARPPARRSVPPLPSRSQKNARRGDAGELSDDKLTSPSTSTKGSTGPSSWLRPRSRGSPPLGSLRPPTP